MFKRDADHLHMYSVILLVFAVV